MDLDCSAYWLLSLAHGLGQDAPAQSGVFDAGRGMTRHPRKGAAQQLWLLYRNHQEISDLQNLRRCRAPEVAVEEPPRNQTLRQWRRPRSQQRNRTLGAFDQPLSSAHKIIRHSKHLTA